MQICCFYWSQNCDVNLDRLMRRFRNNKKNVNILLKNGIIKQNNGKIFIYFLDFQLNSIEKEKKFYSDMGKLGQKRKKEKAPLKSKIKPPLSIDKDKEKDKEKDKDHITVFSFYDFWNAYSKKTGRVKCEKKYKSIKEADREKIKDHVPLYVQSTPDPKFRKDPLTYLNGRHWEDEIIKQRTWDDV